MQQEEVNEIMESDVVGLVVRRPSGTYSLFSFWSNEKEANNGEDN